MKNLLKTGAAFFAVAILSFVGFKAAFGYGGDPCTVPITPPAGGFVVKNLSGSPVSNPTIKLEFTAGGDASFVQVSNYPDFSNSYTYAYDPQAVNTANWTLTSGYATKNVYARYLNSCKSLPSPTIIIEVKYSPYACYIGVTPPAGGFKVTSLSGSTVTDPNIQLGLSGGSASFVQVSNNSNFSNSSTYPYSSMLNWTLSAGYGTKTVYVRYLNSCKTLPSPTVSVKVTYKQDVCSIAVTPPSGGFKVISLSGSIVTNPNIQLGLSGGNAAYAEVSDNANFTNSVIYTYASTINWLLPFGYGNKTVYVRYLNSCLSQPSAAVSVTVNYVDYCSIGATPPAGGFSVTSLSGLTVTTQTIGLGLNGGNAAYADVSNFANFSSYTEFAVASSVNWTLTSGYGSKTVYVRYLNSCKAMPSAPVSVTVNYTNACSVGLTPPPNGFMVTSLGTVNVHTPNVKLGMFGGNASYMEVSNNSNFSGSTTYPYATTLDWTLSSGYGNKTVWVRYWNSCKAMSSIGVSISFTYTR